VLALTIPAVLTVIGVMTIGPVVLSGVILAFGCFVYEYTRNDPGGLEED
jgi:hypothetical protein